MTLSYTARADSDIRTVAQTRPDDWKPLSVKAYRTDGAVVVDGTITLYVVEKAKKKMMTRILLTVAIVGLLGAFGAAVALMLATDWLTPWWGWKPLPDRTAPTHQTFEPEYRGFAALATQALVEERARIGAPSLSAAVVLEDSLVWAGTAGWARVDPPEPATTKTVYRIGSTSKAVTATAMARLVASRQLDLDAPIERYVETVPNPQWASLTPRQLASHTAGLPGYAENRDFPGVWQTIRLARSFGGVEEALSVFDGTQLLFEPGAGFHYSSFDTTVNAWVMASITGHRYPMLLRELVLHPLGLIDTGVERAGDLPDTIASFYRVAGGRVRPWRDVDLSLKWPGGGLLSTSTDLARLGSAWLDESFLPASLREDFWTPVQLVSGEVNEQSYAMGWRVNRSRRIELDGGPVREVHHGGVSKGAMSWLVVYPDLELVVAININARAESFGDFAAAETRLTRLVIAHMLQPEPAP